MKRYGFQQADWVAPEVSVADCTLAWFTVMTLHVVSAAWLPVAVAVTVYVVAVLVAAIV